MNKSYILHGLIVLTLVGGAAFYLTSDMVEDTRNSTLQALNLQSIRMSKVKNQTQVEALPYVEFDNSDYDEPELFLTDICPVKEYTFIGQWMVTSHIDDLSLEKIPFKAYRGSSGNPSLLATEYKVHITESGEYIENPFYSAEFIAGEVTEFIFPVEVELENEMPYYITLEAKSIVASPHQRGQTLIVPFDTSGTVLGTFVQSEIDVSRKSSDIRFKSFTRPINLNTRESAHPNPECRSVRIKTYNRSKWNTYFFK